MNLRELWDTVVLRDILGYIFPGCITLLALSLLLAQFGLVDVWSSLNVCRNLGILGLLAVMEQHLVLLMLIAAVAYAIGHLQIWVIECLEDKVPCWDNGKLALGFLCEERMGEDYARAGLRLSKLRERSGFGQEPLIQSLRKSKQERQKQWQSALARLCHSQRSSAEDDRTQQDAETQAKEVWRLCDRYVLHKNRDMHSMFMGRYYVLAVLFSNLGISAIFIGAVIILIQLGPCRPGPLSLLLFLVGVVALVSALLASLLSCTIGALCVALVSVPLSLAIAGYSPLALTHCVAPRIPSAAAALFALVSGALMLARSSYFRKRFVECTFSIFYAMVQAEKGERDQQT